VRLHFFPHHTEATNKRSCKAATKPYPHQIHSKTQNGYIMPLRTLQRGKDKPYLTEGQKQAARRVGDLSRIYRDQYPNGLPHNDVGVKYALTR
jgi:hypothetical protein